jgi:hypothetical protein
VEVIMKRIIKSLVIAGLLFAQGLEAAATRRSGRIAAMRAIEQGDASAEQIAVLNVKKRAKPTTTEKIAEQAQVASAKRSAAANKRRANNIVVEELVPEVAAPVVDHIPDVPMFADDPAPVTAKKYTESVLKGMLTRAVNAGDTARVQELFDHVLITFQDATAAEKATFAAKQLSNAVDFLKNNGMAHNDLAKYVADFSRGGIHILGFEAFNADPVEVLDVRDPKVLAIHKGALVIKINDAELKREEALSFYQRNKRLILGLTAGAVIVGGVTIVYFWPMISGYIASTSAYQTTCVAGSWGGACADLASVPVLKGALATSEAALATAEGWASGNLTALRASEAAHNATKAALATAEAAHKASEAVLTAHKSLRAPTLLEHASLAAGQAILSLKRSIFG